jgi:hypothetical protein
MIFQFYSFTSFLSFPVLPNKKRQFKEHDRVCERHFDESDIVQFWESNINGQVHLTPRDKPKLRENAIPSKNLPTADANSLKPEEEILKIRNEKVKILSNKIVFPAKRKLKKDVDDEEKKPSKVKKVEAIVVITPVLEEKTDKDDEMLKVIEAAEIEFAVEVTTTEHQEVFENLYDEAFDVTLPSLLWGIHRDPERKFIAFSEFNQKTMSNCKLLHITDSLRCTSFMNNVLKSSQMLQIQGQVMDFVSAMLEELDKEPLA